MGGLLHLVQLGGAWAACNSPPINGECTIWSSVALRL